MSDDAELAAYRTAAAEEAIRRNTRTVVDLSEDMRRRVDDNTADVRRLAGDVNALRALFEQQLVAFASTTQRVYRLEAELALLREEVGDDGPVD